MNDRDYFAAAALTGMLADGEIGYGRVSPDDIASKAFELAEAMMRARERGHVQEAARCVARAEAQRRADAGV